MPSSTLTQAPAETRIYRVEVAPTDTIDPLGRRVAEEARSLGMDVGEVSTRRIYLIETAAEADEVREAALSLLADGIAESADFQAPGEADAADSGAGWVEVHLKPGVMDPVAKSCEAALDQRGLAVVEVRTGRAYRFAGAADEASLRRVADRVLANGVIESVHLGRFHPTSFEHGRPYTFRLRHVPIRDLDDEGLRRLSREGHLFLSLTEMRAIQDYFRQQQREPTDAELETLAQTWSEHCVHKTLKSHVLVEDEQGKVVREYGNLIRDTIFASTQELMKADTRPDGPFCLSVFKDNAGVIAFDEADGVCFKVETHNRPSAIEPYGGAATGIGGVIRDVLGTGLGARPVANTDVFCVAPPDVADLPRGVIRPQRILQQIAAGVRDYGNRMGIPTVNGAIYYDPNYVANPLVFCGCVGVIPRDKIEKAARRGDRIVVMGGRTGRDGIHGATFSSAELTDTHGSEFAHAVQIGNAITEKKVADVLLEARDRGLFSAVTDCGAGGLSSAIGEMGEKIGAFVELDRVTLKYAGLRYDEIWISEAQERMVLSVPADKLDELLALSASEDVEATDVGHFGTDGEELILHYEGNEVGRLSMSFLHDGIPMPTRKAVVRGTGVPPVQSNPAGQGFSVSQSTAHKRDARATDERLLSALSHPNIASKHRIVRQYDHEVLGGSVVKPFVGPVQIGPADAAVVRPKLTSRRGVAIACGLAPHIADPYEMAVAGIDEAVRNAVCVGADIGRLALLDNFCWPGTDDPEAMGTLVRACEACRDVALAFGTPFVSGKDSLHNQFTDKHTGRVIKIPPTLLISAIAIVDDIARCCTSDLKRPGQALSLVRPAAGAAGATLPQRLAVHQTVSDWITSGRISAAHDVSDGGWLVAAAEMCIGGNLGLSLTGDLADAFDEAPTTYLLAHGDALPQVEGVEVVALGQVIAEPQLRLGDRHALSVEQLVAAWRGEAD